MFSAPAGVSVGLGMMALAFVLSLIRRPRWPLSAVVLLTGVFVLYALGRGLLASYPGGSFEVRMEAAIQWALLLLFVPLAYLLRGEQGRLLRLLGLALLGLVIGALWRLDWGLLLAAPADLLVSRPGFGFPANVFGLFAGTALIGLVVLRRRCWAFADPWGLALWWLATVLVAQGFLMTLSRGAVLALGLTAAVGLASAISAIRASALRVTPRFVLALLTTAAVLMALYAGPMAERLTSEWGTVQGMLAGEIGYAPDSSLSQRWHAQRFGIAAWMEHPWLGWGPGAGRALLAASGDPTVMSVDVGPLVHLHNTYLEVLVQLGLLGLLLWLGILALLFRAVHKGYVAGCIDADVARFLALALLFLMLWNLFDFHAMRQPWRAYWALLAGAALSVGLFAGTRAEAGGQR